MGKWRKGNFGKKGIHDDPFEKSPFVEFWVDELTGNTLYLYSPKKKFEGRFDDDWKIIYLANVYRYGTEEEARNAVKKFKGEKVIETKGKRFNEIKHLVKEIPYSKKFNGETYSRFTSSFSDITQKQEAAKMRKAGIKVRTIKFKRAGRTVYTLYTKS